MISIGLLSCKGFETESIEYVNQNRKEELISLATTGNYISSVEEMEIGIKALFTCGINSRSAKTDEIELSVLDKIQLDTNMGNISSRSTAIAKEADSEFYIYNIENKTKKINGYAITSTDRRIRTVTATSEIVESEKDEAKKAQKKALVDEKIAQSTIKTMDDLLESIFKKMQQDKIEYDSNPDSYSSGIFSIKYDSELHYIKTVHSILNPLENKNIDGNYS